MWWSWVDVKWQLQTSEWPRWCNQYHRIGRVICFQRRCHRWSDGRDGSGAWGKCPVVTSVVVTTFFKTQHQDLVTKVLSLRHWIKNSSALDFETLYNNTELVWCENNIPTSTFSTVFLWTYCSNQRFVVFFALTACRDVMIFHGTKLYVMCCMPLWNYSCTLEYF